MRSLQNRPGFLLASVRKTFVTKEYEANMKANFRYTHFFGINMSNNVLICTIIAQLRNRLLRAVTLPVGQCTQRAQRAERTHQRVGDKGMWTEFSP